MAETRADPALYRKLWQQTRLYRPHLGALLALHVLSGALKLLAPLPLLAFGEGPRRGSPFDLPDGIAELGGTEVGDVAELHVLAVGPRSA